MANKTPAPYGTWKSDITSETVLSGNIVFDDVLVDPKTQAIYHLEESPKDGRCLIVRTRDNKYLLPSSYSARTSVQAYGGAPAIVYNDVIYFSNGTAEVADRENRIYALNLKDKSPEPKPITPENKLWRYANFVVHPVYDNLLVTVREDHTDDPDGTAPGKVVNTLCAVNTHYPDLDPVKIVEGAGFYASPVINPSPFGNRIAWQQWDLPDMPWQGGLIYVADIVAEPLASIEVSKSHVLVAGEKGNKSATFPRWITDTTLLYITDGDNKFQNPFIFDTYTNSTPVLSKPLAQDFSEPAWYLGQDPYAILGDGKYAAFTAFQDGRNILYLIDLTQPSEPVPIKNFDFTVAQHLRPVSANSFVFTGIESSDPGGVILGTVSGWPGSPKVDFKVLKHSGVVDEKLQPFISPPTPMNLGVPHDPLYVVLYKPRNPNYSGDPEEQPPCIVGVHGGPTGLEPQALNWIKMFYTSRGFAWLDVNYRGSSGYGRDYINLLNGNWGIYDVDDCRKAVQILAGRSEIDGKRVAIRGGSAGGYTTLASLTFGKNQVPKYPDYKTACSAYGGVTDPTLLAKITEKFEMQYIDTLFGCPPGPDGKNWDSRSPIKNIIDPKTELPNLSVPLLMLHGLKDQVVPPEIARNFLKDITGLLPTEQLEFAFYAGEGHHWRLATTIQDALEREFTWYKKNLL